MICGGESLTKPIQQRFFDSAAQGLYNFYGPTEGAIDATWWRCVPEDPSSSAPIGRATTNRTLYVLDELGQPVPIGVPGELFIGGVGVAAGYLNQPELSAERFLDDPFRAAPGARMYRTGDRVRYRPDGALEFLGRVDRQIKVRGVRIEPDEIEVSLCRHPQVSGCAVSTRPTGAGEKRLVAYLSTRGAEPPTTRELRSFAQASLPAEMVPSAFVLLETLPKTSTGKVDFKALPPIDWSALESESGTPLATDTQSRVAGIWTEVLELPVEDVAADFFELGGHSLLAVQVLSRIRDEWGVDVSISEFFDDPSVGGLATTVDAKKARGGARAEPSLPESADALSGTRPILLTVGHAVGPHPLYLVHPADGGPMTYADLGARLDVPAVAIGAPGGADGVGVEEVAARYVEELLRTHAGGGFLIGGWSTGGVVAFEMARQLEARGERVGGVVLLDTPGPSQWPNPVDAGEALLQFGAAKAEPTAAGAAERQEAVDRARDTLLACAAYQPGGRLRADVALIRAVDGARTPGAPAEDLMDLGWLEHVGSRLFILESPGDHLTMLFGDHAPVLGRRVAEAVATLGRG